MDNELIKIVGGFISILLGVNAYYFKDIVTTLTEIKITLVKLNTEHDNNISLIQKHDAEIDKMRERVHSLEGAQSNILKFIEDTEHKD